MDLSEDRLALIAQMSKILPPEQLGRLLQSDTFWSPSSTEDNSRTQTGTDSTALPAIGKPTVTESTVLPTIGKPASVVDTAPKEKLASKQSSTNFAIANPTERPTKALDKDTRQFSPRKHDTLAAAPKPTQALIKSKLLYTEDIRRPNEHGDTRWHENNSVQDINMSDGYHSSGNDSWTEKPPATPKKRPVKTRTPQKPRTKTQRDRVEKTRSPTKLVSRMAISSPPLLGTAAKNKVAALPSPEKRTSSRQPPASQNSTINSQIPPTNIQKVKQPKFVNASPGPRRFVIGLDFGTTFTSVSYFAHPLAQKHPRPFPKDVKVIMNWPKDGMGGARRQVPTESWYPSVARERSKIDNQYEPTSFNDTVDYSVGSSDDEDENGSKVEVPRIVERIDLDNEESTSYLWGYDVPYQIFKGHTSRDEYRRIIRPKLMLVPDSKSVHTEDDRIHLRPRLQSLIEQGLIRKFAFKNEANPRDVQDVISDFLAEVLKHTKQQLVENEHYTADSKVFFALTIPVIWQDDASLILEFALAAAIQESGFGELSYGCVDDLFLLPEPEAAATYLLGHSHDMLAGETFIVLDCGGGTVDCVTYTVTCQYPLRLQAEVDEPSGDNCGASYLNDNFENLLLQRLAGEKYLERDGETIESVVRELVPIFEDYDKRNKDIARKPKGRYKIKGLRSDRERSLAGASAKGFENNMLILSSDDYNTIFNPLLTRVGHVLWDQIDKAVSKRKAVKKVFLIGGFGACPSLQSYLRRFLEDAALEMSLGYEISLATTSDQESLTAVSSGAVLRALDPSKGPERKARCSYGFLQLLPYDPDFEGHKSAEIIVDPYSKERYVRGINYFMLKGDILESGQRFEPIPSCHTFKINEKKLFCEECVYVSYLDIETNSDGSPMKSDYWIGHPYNKGILVAGKALGDLSYLRDEGRILPVGPGLDEEGVVHDEAYWKINYDIVITVQGRNLTYDLVFPSGDDGKTVKSGRISLASAFRPGTC